MLVALEVFMGFLALSTLIVCALLLALLLATLVDHAFNWLDYH